MDADAQAAYAQAQLLHTQSFCPENVQHNVKQLYYIRSVFTSVAGSAAGVLGLTNLDGFYFYAASLLVANLCILLVNAHASPSKFLVSFRPMPSISSAAKGQPPQQSSSSSGGGVGSQALGLAKFLIDGLQEMAFGYVLWWTLWTGLIHVYD